MAKNQEVKKMANVAEGHNNGRAVRMIRHQGNKFTVVFENGKQRFYDLAYFDETLEAD